MLTSFSPICFFEPATWWTGCGRLGSFAFAGLRKAGELVFGRFYEAEELGISTLCEAGEVSDIRGFIDLCMYVNKIKSVVTYSLSLVCHVRGCRLHLYN